MLCRIATASPRCSRVITPPWVSQSNAKRDIAALVERGFLPEGNCTDAEFDRAVIAMLEIIQAANLTA